jgi:peptide/nickel transport system ATP-binding protein
VSGDGTALLQVTGLQVHFPIKQGIVFDRTVGQVRAVDGVDLTVARGQTYGLVGESGCGKSTTSRLITRLLEPTSGSILFEGNELAHASEVKLRPYRRDLQIVFQDPYSSLNPRHTVATILSTPLRVHGLAKGREKQRVQELLELVGLNPEHINRYPNEFSGGQRQRIGIARALAVEPKLIIADEPVSALDVSIQAQVMNLLGTLRRELDLAFIFIAHDLGVVRHFCDRVAVMYLGKIVEQGDRHQIYTAPQHPYTQALLSAAPDINVVRGVPPKERIRLVGDVPSPVNPPSGCRFRTRCWKAQDICAAVEPPLESKNGATPDHTLACHFPEVKTELTAEVPA